LEEANPITTHSRMGRTDEDEAEDIFENENVNQNQ